ncbi:MAG: hypothetical protein OEV35_03645 [Gallionellaceae bacterium]|nr:hypothetical protein [Gallionellaceae bacterium]
MSANDPEPPFANVNNRVVKKLAELTPDAGMELAQICTKVQYTNPQIMYKTHK